MQSRALQSFVILLPIFCCHALQAQADFLVAFLTRTQIRAGRLRSEIEQQSCFSPPWHDLNSLQVVFHFLIYACSVLLYLMVAYFTGM